VPVTIAPATKYIINVYKNPIITAIIDIFHKYELVA